MCDRLDIAGDRVRRKRARRKDVDGHIVLRRLEGNRRQSHLAGRLRGRLIRSSDQPRWPSASQLEELIDGRLPLIEVEFVADGQPSALALVFEATQFGHAAIEVVEGGSNPSFVGAAAGSGKLTQA